MAVFGFNDLKEKIEIYSKEQVQGLAIHIRNSSFTIAGSGFTVANRILIDGASSEIATYKKTGTQYFQPSSPSYPVFSNIPSIFCNAKITNFSDVSKVAAITVNVEPLSGRNGFDYEILITIVSDSSIDFTGATVTIDYTALGGRIIS